MKNIYNDNELDKQSTTEEFSVVRKEGSRQVRRTLEFYNLDAITGQTAAEYSIFNKTQQITSDFDRAVQKLIENQ